MAKVMTTTAMRNHRNLDDFTKEINYLYDAAVGLIIVKTREAWRCQEALWRIARKANLEFRVWTCVDGWVQHSATATEEDYITVIENAKPDDGTVAITAALEQMKDITELNSLFVMHNIHHYLTAPVVQQRLKDHVRWALNHSLRLVVILPETAEVPTDLEDDCYFVDFKTPSHVELKEAWPEGLSGIEKKLQPDFSDEDVDLIVQNAIGMSMHEFDTAVALTLVKNRERVVNVKKKGNDPLTPQDFINELMESKLQLIKRTDILELMNQDSMNDVGGLDLMKDWVTKRSRAFSDEAREYGIEPPKGVLVVGPPGTGKSLFSKAVASVLGTPCIKLDIGKVFGKFVGESEGKMHKALKLVESMAPCVLLVDEIDKAFGGIGSGGDSGVTSRVFGKFLSWMQDRDQFKSPVFIVATANNVVGMPPEMLRKGRMDEIFAATFPGINDRKAIAKIHVEKRGHSLTEQEYDKLSKETDGCVGAEVEAIIKDAIIRSFNNNDKALTIESCVYEANKLIPAKVAFKEKIEAMNNWAKNNAKPASSEDELFKKQVPIKKRNVNIKSKDHMSSG